MKALRRLVVPVNGSASDQDALELACIVARRHRARVEAVFVIQVKRSLPLDADMSTEKRDRISPRLVRWKYAAGRFCT